MARVAMAAKVGVAREDRVAKVAKGGARIHGGALSALPPGLSVRGLCGELCCGGRRRRLPCARNKCSTVDA